QQVGQSRIGNFEFVSVLIIQDKGHLTSRIQPKAHQVDVNTFVRRFDSTDEGHAIVEARDLAWAEKTESAFFCQKNPFERRGGNFGFFIQTDEPTRTPSKAAFAGISEMPRHFPIRQRCEPIMSDWCLREKILQP